MLYCYPPIIVKLMPKPVIFSGIQSTGLLHLGNLLGTVLRWKNMQDDHSQRFYCVVDHHAITARITRDHSAISFDKKVGSESLDMAASLLACGIDPRKSCLFLQSWVPAHLELFWILSCLTPMGWLQNMTQFKSKGQEERLTGLFSYPILMAADIMLYRTTVVPVGEDQVQHCELALKCLERTNLLLGCNLPRFELMVGQGGRVRSLTNGQKKMSKSEADDFSRINISDSKQLVLKKIKKAKTDSLPGITLDAAQRPELHNLLQIYSQIANVSLQQAESTFKDSSKQAFKAELGRVVAAFLGPIREQHSYYGARHEQVRAVLEEGSRNARLVAELNIREIKEKVGFCLP